MSAFTQEFPLDRIRREIVIVLDDDRVVALGDDLSIHDGFHGRTSRYDVITRVREYREATKDFQSRDCVGRNTARPDGEPREFEF